MTAADGNRATYGRPEAVGFYAGYTGLQPPEEAWLAEHRDELARARLLDLGVGGGRTAVVLAPLVGHYVGVDYAPELVEAARRRCPGVDLRVGDARALAGLDDASFDVVLFSFNGIDTVGHDDRRAVLAEVHRVLVPGGLFLFSAHNLDHDAPPRFPWPWPPRPTRAWLGRMRRALAIHARHRRLRRDLPSGDGWAARNDGSHEYRLVNEHVTRTHQEAQLRAAGFDPVSVLALDGSVSTDPDRDSAYLSYAARRR